MIKAGIKSLESLLTEKIEIETNAHSTDKVGLYAGKKEIIKVDTSQADGKGKLDLMDLTKGISGLAATQDNAKAENLKRITIQNAAPTSAATAGAPKAGIVKPFSEKIKALITKIKS